MSKRETENTQNEKYDAFISYRHLHPDMDVAMKLQRLLETYKPPRTSDVSVKRRLRIFTDKTELPLNSNLGEGIRSALRNSEYLIVVCSPETQHSKWCMEEVRYFKELHNGTTERILIVLAAGRPEQTFFPEITHTRAPAQGGASFSEMEIEPLCADAASESTAGSLRLLKKEFLRVAAPILGCGYDELVQRSRKRRQKRIAAAAAAACVLLIAGVLTAQQISSALKQKDAQVEEQQDIIEEQSYQSVTDDINLKTTEIETDIENGRKIDALQKMAALWSAHSDDQYTDMILDNLALSAVRANYVERFTAWAETPLTDGSIFGISQDGETVAVCGYPKDGTVTVRLYDKLLTNEKTLKLPFDLEYGGAYSINISDDSLEIVTWEDVRYTYDLSGNLTGQSQVDRPNWTDLYNETASAFSNLGSFDHASQGMYSVEGDRIAVLFSNPSSEEYDFTAAGGFLVYNRESGEYAAFPIPAPEEISYDNAFEYASIALVPGRDIVLISLNQGIYASFVTAYSTVTGEELCDIEIADAAVNVNSDCSFSPVGSGWIIMTPTPAGGKPPYVAYFSLPVKQEYDWTDIPSYEWTYGKKLFDKKIGSIIMTAVYGDTLYVLTGTGLQAMALSDMSLTDKLARAPSFEDFDTAYESNPLVESEDDGPTIYGPSVPDQKLELNNGLTLHSTATPWYYDDKFYTGVQLQLCLLDKNGNSLFSMQQLDIDAYPYYSEKDQIFGFVTYEEIPKCVLLPLKDTEEILKSAQAVFNN